MIVVAIITILTIISALIVAASFRSHLYYYLKCKLVHLYGASRPFLSLLVTSSNSVRMINFTSFSFIKI